MNTPSEEPITHELLSRLAALEQAHARLHEELTHVRAERAPAAEEQTSAQTRPRPRRSSRRKMLTKGLGVAAVATVGAGALLELSSGTALAASTPKPGVFASSVAGTPAVKATGTNGADGVDATSDSGTGVSASSSSGTGLLATSSSGLAGHFVGGDVDMDKNLTVAGALSTGTLNSGAGTFASSVSGTPAVTATGTNGAHGVDASSDSGFGVSGSSTNGVGVVGNGNGIGVSGTSTSGFGVHGSSTDGTGVFGTSTNLFGVFGESGGTGINAIGVVGNGTGTGGTGVVGNGRSTNGTGVAGFGSSVGVFGISTTSGGLAGLFDGDVQVNGNFSATGTKAFVQAHPTDPSREIVYVALEGGEAGTYVRGSGQLQSGKAVLALPEHFGLVTETSGLTVQLTPRGEWLQLYVVELDTAQLVVREAQGKSGAFDYLICGVRRGYEQHEVLRTKR